ncbi:sulfotransferase [Ponticaulis profundi]|uniref:Sulfotransferase n=1 Tax=Ponticaulis profundi TaxID=2665222 RepID=A0ABW1S4B0_9PROT
MKYFIVGLPKSGTTTLHEAFNCSGIPSVHWKCRRTDRFVGRVIYNNFFNDRLIFKSLEEYEAITQADFLGKIRSLWPQCHFALLRKIRLQYPECTFILNYRNPAHVVKSIETWRGPSKLGPMLERFSNLGAPGLPAEYVRRNDALRNWIENHYEFIRYIMRDDPKFVEYDIEDPNAKSVLENRLGISLAWWGRANETLPKQSDGPEFAGSGISRP